MIRMRQSLQWLVGPCLLLAIAQAAAQDMPANASAFDELRRELRWHSSSASPEVTEAVRIEMTGVRDCGNFDPAAPDAGSAESSSSQYIYNADYSWSIVQAGTHRCVSLTRPELRALSREEAHDLFLASRTQFPVPPDGIVGSIPGATRANVAPRFMKDDIDVRLDGPGAPSPDTITQRIVPLRGPAPAADDR